MVGRNTIQGTRNRPVTGECITTGQRLGNQAGSALVELLFNDPEVTKIKRTRRRATCERSMYESGVLRGRYRNHPRWSSRVHGSNTPQAFEPSTQCCLTLPSRGTSKGWRPWPPRNVKHHEAGDRRSIDSTIRGSWRHRAPSQTGVFSPYICTAPQWMAA